MFSEGEKKTWKNPGIGQHGERKNPGFSQAYK